MVSALDGLATRADVGIAKVEPHDGGLVDSASAIAGVGLLVGTEMLAETFARKVDRPVGTLVRVVLHKRQGRTGRNFGGRPYLPGRREQPSHSLR
jgi:hypothetical protein